MPHLQSATHWLSQLLELMGYSSSVTSKLQTAHHAEEEEVCWLYIGNENLTPQQIETLIGIDGSHIDAIQYLANLTLNGQGQPEASNRFYIIELDGYRAKRQIELQAIAEQAAQKARETAQEIEIANLSAADRRQVHTFLKQFNDLETFSQGKEPHRHLIVRLSTAS